MCIAPHVLMHLLTSVKTALKMVRDIHRRYKIPRSHLYRSGMIMKLVEGTYALIPSTNYGVFTAAGAEETRLVRITANADDGGKWSMTLTTVGTFPTRDEAIAEVVFCPGCKQVYLRSDERTHFFDVPHRRVAHPDLLWATRSNVDGFRNTVIGNRGV